MFDTLIHHCTGVICAWYTSPTCMPPAKFFAFLPVDGVSESDQDQSKCAMPGPKKGHRNAWTQPIAHDFA